MLYTLNYKNRNKLQKKAKSVDMSWNITRVSLRFTYILQWKYIYTFKNYIENLPYDICFHQISKFIINIYINFGKSNL